MHCAAVLVVLSELTATCTCRYLFRQLMFARVYVCWRAFGEARVRTVEKALPTPTVMQPAGGDVRTAACASPHRPAQRKKKSFCAMLRT